MSCCMCEPTETAQSLGDDAHAVATRPKWAREHGTQSVVLCVCGLRAGLQAVVDRVVHVRTQLFSDKLHLSYGAVDKSSGVNSAPVIAS